MLDKPAKDGTSQREHLESAARRGNASAIRALAGPEMPECLEYLYGFAMELRGRSGVGMSGFAPLSYSTIADWSKLKQVELRREEVDALILLDGVLSYPESGSTDDDD